MDARVPNEVSLSIFDSDINYWQLTSARMVPKDMAALKKGRGVGEGTPFSAQQSIIEHLAVDLHGSLSAVPADPHPAPLLQPQAAVTQRHHLEEEQDHNTFKLSESWE